MISENQYPALLLNADYRPLSIHPLSVLPWQKAVRKVMLGKITPVSEYDVTVSSSAIRLPSVVKLRQYVHLPRKVPLTRLNIWLRDGGRCVYCREALRTSELTFDHVVPRSRNGDSTFENLSSACIECNVMKANRTPAESGMNPVPWPYQPTQLELARAARRLGKAMPTPRDWKDFLYWDGELDAG